jgi:hypothetical protein
MISLLALLGMIQVQGVQRKAHKMVQVTTQQEETTAPYCDEIPEDELASYL